MNTPIDISNVTLKTNRMIIRPWRQPDLDDFYEYASVDGVGQMAGWRPHKDKAESQTILDMFIAEKRPSPSNTKERLSALLELNATMKNSFLSFRSTGDVKSAMSSQRLTGDRA